MDGGKVPDHVNHELGRQAVQVALDRVLHQVSVPVVVDEHLDRLVPTIQLLGQDRLDPLIPGERHVRAVVEQEAAGRRIGGRVSADVIGLVKGIK